MDEKYFVAKVQYDLPDENSGKIKKVREERPGSIQSEVQELAISYYEKHLGS